MNPLSHAVCVFSVRIKKMKWTEASFTSCLCFFSVDKNRRNGFRRACVFSVRIKKRWNGMKALSCASSFFSADTKDEMEWSLVHANPVFSVWIKNIKLNEAFFTQCLRFFSAEKRWNGMNPLSLTACVFSVRIKKMKWNEASFRHWISEFVFILKSYPFTKQLITYYCGLKGL